MSETKIIAELRIALSVIADQLIGMNVNDLSDREKAIAASLDFANIAKILENGMIVKA